MNRRDFGRRLEFGMPRSHDVRELRGPRRASGKTGIEVRALIPNHKKASGFLFRPESPWTRIARQSFAAAPPRTIRKGQTMRLRADLRRALFVATALTLSPAALASSEKSMAPIPGATLALMRAKGVSPASPILIRAYKKEAEMEVWKQGRDGRYVLLKTFPICRWSGQLGPKTTLGDRQTPEGFYAVGPAQMNPNSSYYLSFDIGFPNAFDQARGGSGSYLMVHGTCSSAGCFAMTDKGIGEIYALAREAFAGGQPAFQFQSYPFRMTAENMAKHRLDANIGFWRQLKEGADRFEATREELGVGASGGRYVFAAAGDPNREALAQARRAEEDARIAALVVQGKPAVRIAYADGGMHASFRTLARRKGSGLGQVSRPDALA